MCKKIALFGARLLICFEHLLPFDPTRWSLDLTSFIQDFGSHLKCFLGLPKRLSLCLLVTTHTFIYSTTPILIQHRLMPNACCRLIWHVGEIRIFLMSYYSRAYLKLTLLTRISNDLDFVGFRLYSLLRIERALVKQGPFRIVDQFTPTRSHCTNLGLLV